MFTRQVIKTLNTNDSNTAREHAEEEEEKVEGNKARERENAGKKRAPGFPVTRARVRARESRYVTEIGK